MRGMGDAKIVMRDFFYWDSSSSLHFNEEGKHIIAFDEDFPLIVKPLRLQYDHKLTPNYHDYLELTYVFGGKGSYHVRNKIYSVNTGDLLVVSAGELHTFTTNYDDPLKLLSLYFLPELFYRPGLDMMDFELIRPILNKDTEAMDILTAEKLDGKSLLETFTLISGEVLSGTFLGKIRSKNLLASILISLLEQYAKVPLSERKKYEEKKKVSHRLAGVFRLVNERYSEKISLEEAASVACMSPNYFCRYFKKATGSSFTEYVMRLRIDMAKKMLLSGKYPLKKIAYQVGFDNLSYFYRIFGRFTQLKPSEFVEKSRAHI